MARGEYTDPTLVPILEKIARKGKDSYREEKRRLAEAARRAIQRIRINIEVHGRSPESGDSGAAACSTCGAIPGTATVNAGPDEFFGVPVASLTQHRLGSEIDLRECPECGDLFCWRRIRASTVADDDAGTLSRSPSAQAAALRAFVKPDAGAVVDPAALAASLLELSDAVREHAALYLCVRDRDLARRLVPALLRAAAQGNLWCEKFLRSFTSTPEDAALVLDLLEGEPKSLLQELRAQARGASCAICRPIVAQAPQGMDRPTLQTALAPLRQLGATVHNELWECPACESLFRWGSRDGRDGEVARVEYRIADAWRKCAAGRRRRRARNRGGLRLWKGVAGASLRLRHATRLRLRHPPLAAHGGEPC